ncbi:hypothetical protein DFP72DRAFT_853136 [Ephemerocybe angulata]|uniref:Uncharacterized protein n=1 Tax=Ephemerocybe angulata TaxID=980116 RepID=A0A8H6HLR4_9AGAR|nr:hypothetical protein DFP72DRAFT_854631 [Tulosesus angulatus]KAF6748750.1 hypothetical protein DFP72DRAFT_853136 [Tulosesus angulatus]
MDLACTAKLLFCLSLAWLSLTSWCTHTSHAQLIINLFASVYATSIIFLRAGQIVVGSKIYPGEVHQGYNKGRDGLMLVHWAAVQAKNGLDLTPVAKTSAGVQTTVCLTGISKASDAFQSLTGMPENLRQILVKPASPAKLI